MDTQARISEINSFLAFVVGEWPTRRNEVKGQLSRRCSRCILSEKYTKLVDGVCELCRSAGNAAPANQGSDKSAEAALNSILQESAGAGPGNYDAVVLFSGGKDSAFLLHRLTSEYPLLRLAALTVDSSFMSQIALSNCQTIMSKMKGIDHFTVRPKAGLYARAYRHALTHLDSQGCYATVDRMDGDLTFDIGRNFAAMQRAPLLITGLSPQQVKQVLGQDSFESPASVESQRRTQSADFSLDELYDPEELDRYWWNPDRWGAGGRPRVIHPFHAWHYDEGFIPGELARLGLIEPGQDNPLATNNDTIPVMLAVDSAMLGYSTFEPEFAQLVREGRADRQMWLSLFEAVEYLVARGEFLPHCISETLGRLDLHAKDVGLPDLRVNRLPGASLTATH